MARVARRWLLVSVPHEPLWRALNVARGAYLRELGNTPGHLNHWTRAAFVLAAHAEVPTGRVVDRRAGRRSPGRCCLSAGPDEARTTRSFASGARILSIGIASTGIFTFAYLATSSHVLSKGDYGLISLCWSIMFVILSVIYRPIEQLLSRTIADRRARGLSGHPLRVPAAIQFGFALVF